MPLAHVDGTTLEKVAVLGHSCGGCIALQYALRYPRRLSHLILVGTTAAWDGTDQVLAELERRNPGAAVVTALLDVAGDEAEFARGQKLVAATLGFQLMADCDVVSRLGEIDVPTLVLTGRHDFFRPPSQAERMHRGIRGADMIVFERSGHYPFIEEAEAFRAAVRKWISVG